MSDKVYVYNHAIKTGGWFEIPFSIFNLQRYFGVNVNEDELEITDYDVSYSCLTNWSLGEFLSYSRDFYELSNLEKEIVNGMVREFAWWLTEAIYDVETVEIYHCSTDEDFAREIIKEQGNIIPENLEGYFDYNKYAQDIMIEKSVLILDEHYVILD